jgi:hypothetical protein
VSDQERDVTLIWWAIYALGEPQRTVLKVNPQAEGRQKLFFYLLSYVFSMLRYSNQVTYSLTWFHILDGYICHWQHLDAPSIVRRALLFLAILQTASRQ